MLFQTLLTAFLALGLTAPPVTRTVVVAQRLRSVSVTHLHLPMGDSTALETGYKWSVAMITLVHVRFFLQNMSVFFKKMYLTNSRVVNLEQLGPMLSNL